MLECLAWRCGGSRHRWRGGTGTIDCIVWLANWQFLTNSALDALRTKSVLMIYPNFFLFFSDKLLCFLACSVFFLKAETAWTLSTTSSSASWRSRQRSWFPIKNQWCETQNPELFIDYWACWKVPISNLCWSWWLQKASSETKLGGTSIRTDYIYNLHVIYVIYGIYGIYGAIYKIYIYKYIYVCTYSLT